MPWAMARTSSIVSSTSAPSSSSSAAVCGASCSRRSLSSASLMRSATSRCWAPSCTSRSIRAPRLVGHGDDPRARRRQLADRGGQPAHEPAVLEDHERVGRRGLQQRRVLRERGVGVDGRDPPPVHADLGEGPALLLAGRLDAGRRLAHPAVGRVREPVGDLQRRVLERVGQRRAQRLGRGLRPEAEGQPLQRRRGVEAAPQHPDGEAERDEREREHVDPPQRVEARRVGAEPASRVVGREREATEDGHGEHRDEHPAQQRPGADTCAGPG